MQQTGYSIPEIIVTSPKLLWTKRMNIFRLAAVFKERCHVIAYSSMGTADSASVSEGKPRTAGRRHWPLGWNSCDLRYLHPPLLAAHTCVYINTCLSNASRLELKGRNELLGCFCCCCFSLRIRYSGLFHFRMSIRLRTLKRFVGFILIRGFLHTQGNQI
jgi:hypothetical protein